LVYIFSRFVTILIGCLVPCGRLKVSNMKFRFPHSCVQYLRYCISSPALPPAHYNTCTLYNVHCTLYTVCTVLSVSTIFHVVSTDLHCTENSKQLFPEMKLRAAVRSLISNFCIHVSVSDLYIPTIGRSAYFAVLGSRTDQGNI
jgi:hypothetical protein